MAKRVITEVSKLDAVVETKSNEEVNTTPQEKSDEFQAAYDPDNQTVSFELVDGTPVVMKSPKVKQFGLLESFIKQSPQEYLTDTFTLIKLASLCITKFGDKSSVSFDQLINTLEIEDLERMVAGLGFFRDKLDYLTRKKPAV
ncbi:hypothetical protein H6G76_35145 [Nostoc sp. FACHB-152]|uniref:hypothetical protein n=1 Tax=Nostoc sp. FACHB-152 TaxID=2692837 RepID=UPI0016838F5D|nr:hypothetical protein [Nostoc sp. FACHB-152]MBD2452248.1 hypothetical protein [Nostoc sp. FACHB-152]